MTWIQLTRHDNIPILINMDKITSIETLKESNNLTLFANHTDEICSVKESLTEIQLKIKDIS